VETDVFNEANKYYMDQSYEKAAEAYEKLVSMGKVAPEVYFNLGNAYYKTGNIAAAILNYERARRLRPSDPDIAYNLRMANLNTIDKIEPVPQLFYERWWDDYVNEGSVDKRALVAVLLFWIALAVTAVYLFSKVVVVRKITFFLTLFMALAASFTLYLTYLQNRHLNDHRAAIIFSESAYAKSSPDEKSANLFLLHAGTHIEVMDELKGWKKVRIANGNEGWITADAIVVI
jgi:tetratricopeptide (TPR) repeat protein